MLQRLELMIGSSNVEKIKEKTILIIGLGGVGGYAIESLARSGIGKMIIVDYDKIEKTNLNRQIIALNSNIGTYKVDAFYDRIKDINPNCKVIKINQKIDENNILELFEEKIDYVVDACDTVMVKKLLIKICLEKNINIISCMGMGNKLDPSKIKIMDIRKTSYDPIAKVIRKYVKDLKTNKKIMVVCSDEKNISLNSKTISSNAFVPSIAGILCTSYIINDIIKR